MSFRPFTRDLRPKALTDAEGALPRARIDSVLEVLSRLEPATVITLAPDGHDQFLLAVRDLPPDPRCAGAGLFGLEPPAPCTLAAVSFVGSSGAEPGEVRVDALVTDTGHIRSQVHLPDGVQPVQGRAGGVVVDALHRLLGLPCPGPTPPLTAMAEGLWFIEILRRDAAGAGLSWADVARAQTERRSTAGTDTDAGTGTGTPPSPEVVAASIAELADGADWDHLRRAAAIGRMSAPELDPDEAAWMDATMFARWMVESFPSRQQVLDRLERHGPTAASRGVREVLDRIGPG